MPKIKYENFHQYPGVVEGQEPSHFILDPIQFVPYRNTLQNLKPRLEIGGVVPDDTAISVVGNNTLLASTFRFKPMDIAPIEGLDIPGKSAHIAHTNSVALACLTILSRKGKREDHLYTVSAGSLREIGLNVVYAPTGKKGLHVRLVPQYLDESGDIPEEIRESLAALLQANEVSQEGVRRLVLA